MRKGAERRERRRTGSYLLMISCGLKMIPEEVSGADIRTSFHKLIRASVVSMSTHASLDVGLHDNRTWSPAALCPWQVRVVSEKYLILTEY
ncbi:uncharacterized [Tachysurus ichikawai]